MIKKNKKNKRNEEITVILGNGSSLNGSFTFEGVSRIDGNFEGEITSTDTLIIGELANVKANVNVGILMIEGTIEGEITASEEIIIHSKGKLYGNINTPALVIEKGAIFEGQSSMSSNKDKIKNIEEIKKEVNGVSSWNK